jgi:hypothetical protein
MTANPAYYKIPIIRLKLVVFVTIDPWADAFKYDKIRRDLIIISLIYNFYNDKIKAEGKEEPFGSLKGEQKYENQDIRWAHHVRAFTRRHDRLELRPGLWRFERRTN